MSSSDGSAPRDHLFISYASEDEAFAKWLALRLTAEGYKVWISCFELLGGERFPEDITRAIKERTFRMLGLLSEHSLEKDDPSGERSLAISLGRERDEQFLIPLNIDGRSPTDLDFRTIEFNFIPFADSWAAGLQQLLERLKELGAPRDASAGREVAASAYLPDDVLSNEPEPLYANLLRFERIPEVLDCFRPWRRLTSEEQNSLADEWAFWAQPARTGRRRYFCFSPPPGSTKGGPDGVSWDRIGSGEWRDTDSFLDLYPDHILKPLLRRTVLHHLRGKGLTPVSADNPTELYFPRGLLSSDYLSFRMPDGRAARRKVVGERTYPGDGQKYRYHQAVTVDVLRNLEPRFILKFRIRPYITDLDGERLGRRSTDARRTHLTNGWRNDQWAERHLGICAFMSDEGGRIVIGKQDPVVVNGSLVTFEVPRGINEEAIPKGTGPIYRTGAGDNSKTPEEDTAEREGTNVAG